MSIEQHIQVMVAWTDILVVTAGYILIQVIVVITVIVFVIGVVIIIRRIYREK